MNRTTAKIANEIRSILKRGISDKIGGLLCEAKALTRHGEWYPWLRDEFAMSRQSADRFMAVHKLATKTPKLGDLKIDVSTLYLLADPKTPVEAAKAIVANAKEGLGNYSDAKRIVRDVRAATAAEPGPKLKPIQPRQAALQDQFRAAIETLKALSTKPAKTFAGIVPPDDLEMLANFLRQIARASEAVRPDCDLSIPDFLKRDQVPIIEAGTA
jgi:Protein of unknown function (DUF3102)